MKIFLLIGTVFVLTAQALDYIGSGFDSVYLAGILGWITVLTHNIADLQRHYKNKDKKE